LNPSHIPIPERWELLSDMVLQRNVPHWTRNIAHFVNIFFLTFFKDYTQDRRPTRGSPMSLWHKLTSLWRSYCMTEPAQYMRQLRQSHRSTCLMAKLPSDRSVAMSTDCTVGRSEKMKSSQSLSLGMQKLLNGIRTYPIKYYGIKIKSWGATMPPRISPLMSANY